LISSAHTHKRQSFRATPKADRYLRGKNTRYKFVKLGYLFHIAGHMNVDICASESSLIFPGQLTVSQS
jgi:hypothetical protein